MNICKMEYVYALETARIIPYQQSAQWQLSERKINEWMC